MANPNISDEEINEALKKAFDNFKGKSDEEKAEFEEYKNKNEDLECELGSSVGSLIVRMRNND